MHQTCIVIVTTYNITKMQIFTWFLLIRMSHLLSDDSLSLKLLGKFFKIYTG